MTFIIILNEKHTTRIVNARVDDPTNSKSPKWFGKRGKSNFPKEIVFILFTSEGHGTNCTESK